MTNLSVNVNKIAWLRNARGGKTPDIVELSKIIIDCGAAGITVHPRPDLRHITPEDVYQLRELTLNENIEFNIEGNPYSEANSKYPGFKEIIKIAKPDQCTLVPDSLEQITSDHGWDFIKKDLDRDIELVELLKEHTNRVSFFLDPVEDQLIGAKKVGADRIELCKNLDLDGLTPEINVIQKTMKSVIVDSMMYTTDLIRKMNKQKVYNNQKISDLEAEKYGTSKKQKILLKDTKI